MNDGKSISPKEYLINQLEQTITSEIEGMLYLTNKSETNGCQVLINATTEIEDATFVIDKTPNDDLENDIYSRFAEIIVEEAIEVPTFVVVSTTNEEFKQMLIEHINSPFVEIIGNHVFGTFQMDLAKKIWINEDPKNYNINETFIRLDKIYELSNTVSGLNLNYDGIARKANNKIQIASPDDGAGYASATSLSPYYSAS